MLHSGYIFRNTKFSIMITSTPIAKQDISSSCTHEYIVDQHTDCTHELVKTPSCIFSEFEVAFRSNDVPSLAQQGVWKG